jgi:hypothetical protein
MKDLEGRYATVESTVLDDRRAIRIRPLVSPVSEEMRVQLDEGQLWITYQPLSSTQQTVLEQMLASIDLGWPCAPDPKATGRFSTPTPEQNPTLSPPPTETPPPSTHTLRTYRGRGFSSQSRPALDFDREYLELRGVGRK